MKYTHKHLVIMNDLKNKLDMAVQAKVMDVVITEGSDTDNNPQLTLAKGTESFTVTFKVPGKQIEDQQLTDVLGLPAKYLEPIWAEINASAAISAWDLQQARFMIIGLLMRAGVNCQIAEASNSMVLYADMISKK